MHLQTLIAAGAKNFALFNAPPGGCLPIFLTLFQWRSPILDECGCLAEYNGAARAYNADLAMVRRPTTKLLFNSSPLITLLSRWRGLSLLLFKPSWCGFYAAFYEILKNVEHYGKETHHKVTLQFFTIDYPT